MTDPDAKAREIAAPNFETRNATWGVEARCLSAIRDRAKRTFEIIDALARAFALGQASLTPEVARGETDARREAQEITEIIVRDVAELERTSPDSDPSMMLVTPEELAAIVEPHVTDALLSSQARVAAAEARVRADDAQMNDAIGLAVARAQEAEAQIEARENLCRQVCDNYANKTAEAEAEVARLRAVERAAAAYRQAEQDGTPRMWRGKALHDLATALDDALAAVAPAPPEAPEMEK